jgi:hypothetical protein
MQSQLDAGRTLSICLKSAAGQRTDGSALHIAHRPAVRSGDLLAKLYILFGSVITPPPLQKKSLLLSPYTFLLPIFSESTAP